MSGWPEDRRPLYLMAFGSAGARSGTRFENGRHSSFSQTDPPHFGQRSGAIAGEQDHGSYIREKLGGAKAAILDDDRPMQQRLWSAYLYNLFSLQPQWHPDADAQDEFEQKASLACAPR
jgi:hypothetical protein